MYQFTRSDYATALQLLARVEAQAEEVDGFALAAATVLDEFVGTDVATLFVCDLRSGLRKVVRAPVRPQRCNGGAPLLDGSDRRTRADPALTVTLYRDDRTLVSIGLNRRGAHVAGRHRARLELLLPHLAFLCAHACQAMGAPADAEPWAAVGGAQVGLTAREREVLRWLACGKTDAEIASLLCISPRTVNKHLEHIYVKLGVETRTAAVMRALTAGLVEGCVSPIGGRDEAAGDAAMPMWTAVRPAGTQAPGTG